MAFFKSSTSQAPTFVDYWSPDRLTRSIEEYFGKIYRPQALDPLYKRAQDQMSERISGEYASRGFGALRTGPAAYRASEAARQFGETRAAGEQGQLMDFLKMLQSGAVSYTPQKGPSGFAALAGPLLGAAGKGIGTQIGGMDFGSLFGYGASQPTLPRDWQSGASYN